MLCTTTSSVTPSYGIHIHFTDKQRAEVNGESNPGLSPTGFAFKSACASVQDSDRCFQVRATGGIDCRITEKDKIKFVHRTPQWIEISNPYYPSPNHIVHSRVSLSKTLVIR